MNPHFENYFRVNSSLLGEVFFYHLTLEALLTEIIRRDSSAPSNARLRRLMFSKKADQCLEMGKITPELHFALRKLNKVRNNYGHELGYEISFEDALELAKTCGEAGVEFTDSVDGCNVEQARELGYETFELLNATFRNTFFEVAHAQEDELSIEFTS